MRSRTDIIYTGKHGEHVATRGSQPRNTPAAAQLPDAGTLNFEPSTEQACAGVLLALGLARGGTGANVSPGSRSACYPMPCSTLCCRHLIRTSTCKQEWMAAVILNNGVHTRVFVRVSACTGVQGARCWPPADLPAMQVVLSWTCARAKAFSGHKQSQVAHPMHPQQRTHTCWSGGRSGCRLCHRCRRSRRRESRTGSQ